LVGGALFAVGVASAAQLTLAWIDNTGSTANFIVVAKAGAGSGTVVATPSGINCGRACVATYTAGRVVTLTARERGRVTIHSVVHPVAAI